LKLKKARRVENEKVYIRAVTLGEVVAIKEMDISVIINCKFKLQDGFTVDQDVVVALSNVVGGEYNLADAVM
jgi:hypothetical protein